MKKGKEYYAPMAQWQCARLLTLFPHGFAGSIPARGVLDKFDAFAQKCGFFSAFKHQYIMENKKADIHGYKKRYERTLERIKEATDISEENKKVLFGFKDYCILQGNIGYPKIERYLFDGMRFAKWLGESIVGANKEGLKQFILKIEQKDWSEETKRCFKIMLRKLYRFVEGIEEKGVYPERISWMKVYLPSNNHNKLPEELLTEEEVMKVVQHCKTLRDKALISALYESGCRVSEIGTMQIKHVSFEEYGARLTVNGKTGGRKILVVNSTPYLKEWINQHPENGNPEAFLWVKSKGEYLSYTRITAILKNAAKNAKIKKRIYPHLLRHSRATALASIMPEASMKQYLGWSQASKMAGVYIHMSGKDTDESILRASGIEIKKNNKNSAMQSKKCLRCQTVNEATNIFCKKCGLVLDKKEAEEIINAETEKNIADELMKKLVEDKEILRFLVEKIKEKKLNIN